MSNYRKKKFTVVATPEAPPPQINLTPSRGMRVCEAAEYLGATVCFVRSLIKDKEIPALVLGKRHVLLREDLDSYLDAQRRRA
jgi:excisionase family DNA binding protein